MLHSSSSVSLESLVHGGFFRDAGERIDRDLLSGGIPADGYKKLLYSIYFRQVARLDEAREVLGLKPDGNTQDVNGVFNYVQASLCQGRYMDAIRMIDRLAAGLGLDLNQATDGLLPHLGSIRTTLESLMAGRTGPLPFACGRHPTYWSERGDRLERSPSIVGDQIVPIRTYDAVFCPQSHAWSDIHSHALLTKLLQPHHDFRSFFGGAKPAKRIATEQLLQDVTTITGPALYVPSTLHFGHFLTQCAGFLNPLARTDLSLRSDQPITCLLDGNLPEPFKDMIARGSTRPVIFRELSDQPVRATELIVADCTWIEWHYCHRDHPQLFARVAASYVGPNGQDEPDCRRVYFSRSRLTSGLRLSMNEEILEHHLEAMGFRIIHPQELDLPSLITAMNSAEILIGSMGSAMHNLLFRTSPRPLTTINLAHFLPPYNFAMIEAALGIEDNHYLRACEEVRTVSGEPNSLYFDISTICSRIESIVTAR